VDLAEQFAIDVDGQRLHAEGAEAAVFLEFLRRACQHAGVVESTVDHAGLRRISNGAEPLLPPAQRRPSRSSTVDVNALGRLA